jgi:putative PIN family toxin of toxin-antitoxin system
VRIVIDTNIWISGLLWRGMPWELLRLAEKDQVVLCITPSMLDELGKVLHYERLRPRLEQMELVPSELVAYVMKLTSMFEVKIPEGNPIVAADPDDDIFLHCAISAKAVYVVSGDLHLLDLGEYAGIPILTIRDFLTQEFPALVID